MNDKKAKQLRMSEYASKFRRLAVYCEASYEDPEEFRKLVFAEHLTDVHAQLLVKGNAEAGVISVPGSGEATVVFRGTSTDSMEDVRANTKVKRVPFKHMPEPQAEVHLGYYGQARRINPLILSELARLSIKEVTVTGHSLGGVVAEIWAAMADTVECLTVKEVISFGAPRPGDKAFADHLEKVVPKVIRVVNGYDIAPKWPSAITGYRHPGVVWWFDGSGNLVEDKGNRWHEFFPGPQAKGWADHRIGQYIRRARQAEVN